MSSSRFQIALPNDPLKAFGKHSKIPRDFPKTTENAFQSLHQEQPRFRSSTTSVFESNAKNPAFTEEAMMAFGRKAQTADVGADNAAFQPRHAQDNFDESATHAFRKKRTEEKSSQGKTGNFVAHNSLQNVVMNALEDENTNEWKESAWRKHTAKPSLKMEEEAFPQLGSKDPFPPLGSSKSSQSKLANSPSVSFANLVKKRAEEEAKELEEKTLHEKRRADERKKRQDELDREKKARVLYNKNNLRAIRMEEDEDQELDIGDEEHYNERAEDEDEVEKDESNSEDEFQDI